MSVSTINHFIEIFFFFSPLNISCIVEDVKIEVERMSEQLAATTA